MFVYICICALIIKTLVISLCCWKQVVVYSQIIMMKYPILLTLLAVTNAGIINNNCLVIRNANFEKEVLKDDIKSPYQLTMDYDTNTLFFSFTARKDEMFKIAYLSFKTGDYGVVSGIRGGFASAVNSGENVVYLGGEDGIYKFDYNKKTATNLRIKENANIWQMFYKDGLYFTTYPEETAFLYKHKKVSEVPEIKNIKAMLIAVNNDGNIVYSNSSGLFLFNEHTGITYLLDAGVVNGISADIDGNLYFSTPTGVFYINDDRKVDELFKMDNIYGVAIESNGNIIYATDESIVRLKPMQGDCLNDRFLEENSSD